MFPIFLVIKYYYEVKIGDYSSSEHNSVDRNIALFYGDGGDLNWVKLMRTIILYMHGVGVQTDTLPIYLKKKWTSNY